MADYTYLRHWITREGYGDTTPRPVILECVPSRSGLSLSVHDREKAIFRVNGCGFDRLGCALAEFLETCFMPELLDIPESTRGISVSYGKESRGPVRVFLEGMTGLESMREVADAIGLSVQVHETRSSTLLIITKKGA